MRVVSVAACAAGLLIVAFEIACHCIVNDESHICLVDAHAKSVRSSHHTHVFVHEHFLQPLSIGPTHSCVIGGSAQARMIEHIGEGFDDTPCWCIDDRNTVVLASFE